MDCRSLFFRRFQPVWAGDGLGRFVGLEACIQRPFASRVLVIAGALMRQHQIVVGIEVLRIDSQRALERRDRLVEAALKCTRPISV